MTLLEKGEVCAGSSYGNAGLIVPSHLVPLAAPGVWWQGVKWMLNSESPFYIKPRASLELARWLWRFRAACTPDRVRRAMPLLRRMSVESLELYRGFAEKELDFGFRQAGSMTVFSTPEGLAHGRDEARLLREGGATVEVLDGGAARAAEPALRAGVVGALYCREDALLVPDRFVKGLAKLAESRGVRVMNRHRGDRLPDEAAAASRSVETTRGALSADTVVLAAGAWSPDVGRALGLRVPIQPAKGYSLTYRRPARGPTIPLLPAEGRFSVTPMGEFLRFGGTLELAGMDLSINRRRVEALRRKALACIEGGERLELLEIWRGLRPCTPDGLPLVGRSRRFEQPRRGGRPRDGRHVARAR